MSKTNEELNELKKEVEAVNEKLQELTPEEIAQVSGGLFASPFGVFVIETPVLEPPVDSKPTTTN